MPLSPEQSLIWNAMQVGPQWILRSSSDPLLAVETQTETQKPTSAELSVQISHTPKAMPQSVVTPGVGGLVGTTQAPPTYRRRPGEIRGKATTVLSTVTQEARLPAKVSPKLVTQPLSSTGGHVPLKAKQDPKILARIASADWLELQSVMKDCFACPISVNRSMPVFGEGFQNPLAVIGEAPGRDEDMFGIPFVGKSGKLLRAILTSAGLDIHKQVSFLNVLKCRPTNNRTPEPEEIEACRPFLMRQLELSAPKVVLLLGRTAAQILLASDADLRDLRNRSHTITIGGRAVPAIVTYHPSYVLRVLSAKEILWKDVVQVRRLLNQVTTSD